MYKYRSSSSSLGRGKYENRRSVNFVNIKSILLIWAAQLLEEDLYSEYAKTPHKASANEKVDGPPIALANTNTTSVGNKVYQDNQRFYDVRGSSRNVWEPDVEDPFNHTGSFTPSTEPVIANLSSESSKVTAICISPDPVFFARGRSNGSVSIGFEFHDSTNVNDGMCSLVDFGTWTVEATVIGLISCTMCCYSLA